MANTIYELVNSVSRQAYGKDAIAVTDTNTLVTLGDYVLASSASVEKFTNTLILRIGKTIFSFRAYKNKLADMVLNDFEYGAIMQKIKVDMPAAIDDPTWGLTKGESVDQYKVYVQDVHQKLFYSCTPYVFPLTIQRVQLQEAFTSEANMSAFISMLFGEVQNAIEVAMENLGRATIANYVVNAESRERKLVTEYNAAVGAEITAESALYDKDFISFAVGEIKTVSKALTDMSTLYNDGTTTRHTPFADQRLRLLSRFVTLAETRLQAEVFNENFVRLEGYTELNYWQSSQKGSEMQVKAKDKTGEEKTVDNLIAILHDRDALGIYKHSEYTLTSPMNALGSYYNTFWHEKQMWFNDLSENFVYFTLN